MWSEGSAKTLIESRKSKGGEGGVIDALLWRVTTLRSKQNRLTSAKQNTVGDFISKLRINIVLTGFFWSLSMLYWTLTTVETRNSSVNCKTATKINKDQTKLLLPWQLWAHRNYAYACVVRVNQPLSVRCLFWWFRVLVFRLLAAKSIKHISKNSPKSSKIPDYTRWTHVLRDVK